MQPEGFRTIFAGCQGRGKLHGANARPVPTHKESPMLEGSCLCNAVRYEIHGELGPIVMCHCSRCRKANGSAFATNASVSTSAFHLVQGQEALDRKSTRLNSSHT